MQQEVTPLPSALRVSRFFVRLARRIGQPLISDSASCNPTTGPSNRSLLRNRSSTKVPRHLRFPCIPGPTRSHLQRNGNIVEARPWPRLAVQAVARIETRNSRRGRIRSATALGTAREKRRTVNLPEQTHLTVWAAWSRTWRTARPRSYHHRAARPRRPRCQRCRSDQGGPSR